MGGKALSKFSSSKDQVSGAKFTSASGATIIEYTRSLTAGDGVAVVTYTHPRLPPCLLHRHVLNPSNQCPPNIEQPTEWLSLHCCADY